MEETFADSSIPCTSQKVLKPITFRDQYKRPTSPYGVLFSSPSNNPSLVNTKSALDFQKLSIQSTQETSTRISL